MTENPGIHVLTDARWAELEPLIDEVRPPCKVPHDNLRDCGWPWSRRRLRAGAGPGPRTADGPGAAGLPARRAGMGGRRPRPCLQHLPRPDLGPRRPTGHPAKAHRCAGRLPALDLRQPALGREPLGATERVAGNRNPLRENRQVLSQRPTLRRHLRLAQGLTGLSTQLTFTPAHSMGP